jgi:uncharacterized metal-binding protein
MVREARSLELKCSLCRVKACTQEPGTRPFPAFCPAGTEAEVLGRARLVYDTDDETQFLARAAAQVEATGYGRWPRVQEVMEFARRIEVTHLGIATCIGLLYEAGLLQEILEANSFQVSSVCCKVGSIPKEEIVLQDGEKVHPGQFEALCNPIAQALLLNEAGTGLNIVVGLCVGHDSLFFRHSQAPVTVLVAKDRVTGHNPAAALYTSHSYYRRLSADKE